MGNGDMCKKADHDARIINESIAALDTLVSKYAGVSLKLSNINRILSQDRHSKTATKEVDRKCLPEGVRDALDNLVSLFEDRFKSMDSASNHILENFRGESPTKPS